MKKITIFLVLLFFPLVVFADGIDKYYIEANILNNGDMEVKELKILDGSYNGVLTGLNYSNPYIRRFTGVLDDFEGSSIYNASGIENVKIYGVKYNTKTFDIINTGERTTFNEVFNASNGDYGVYIKNNNEYRIYMPSRYNQATLITYTLKNVVVVHNDIAEIAWDFISGDFDESIEEIIIKINLPGNSEELRVFSHGNLTGYNKIESKKQVVFQDTMMDPYNALDIRVVFDKNLVLSASKRSHVDGLQNILTVEEKRANQANEEREEAIEYIKEQNKKLRIVNIYSIISIVGVIGLAVYFYFKNDKELNIGYHHQYNREFIDDYNVEVIDYLMNKNITPNAMSASIMNLVYKKNIAFEKDLSSKKKDAYKFILLKDSDNHDEKKLMDFLFNVVGSVNTFTTDQLKSYAKSTSTYDSFNRNYTGWKNSVIESAKKQNFWETGNKGLYYAFIAISYGMLLFLTNLIDYTDLSMISTVAHVAVFIYIFGSKKRTQNGALHYAKWKAFKNFLNDFGQFKDREIEHIALWERYLVYATIFGIAHKVQKTMNVIIKEYNIDTTSISNYNMYDYMIINNLINNSVSTAIESNRQTASRVASSQMSSSGGFGGGSSSGGGGFGGGGSTGGRF